MVTNRLHITAQPLGYRASGLFNEHFDPFCQKMTTSDICNGILLKHVSKDLSPPCRTRTQFCTPRNFFQTSTVIEEILLQTTPLKSCSLTFTTTTISLHSSVSPNTWPCYILRLKFLPTIFLLQPLSFPLSDDFSNLGYRIHISTIFSLFSAVPPHLQSLP